MASTASSATKTSSLSIEARHPKRRTEREGLPLERQDLAAARGCRILAGMRPWLPATCASLALLAVGAAWWLGSSEPGRAAHPPAGVTQSARVVEDRSPSFAAPARPGSTERALDTGSDLQRETVSVAAAPEVAPDVRREPEVASLVGRVVTEDGSHLTSFRVLAQHQTYSRLRVDLRFSAADGRFELPGLVVGPWRVSAGAGSDWQPVSDSRLVELPQEGPEPVLVCPAAGAVAGHVFAPDGTPAGGAMVNIRLQTIDVEVATACKTNLDGSFELQGLRAGALSLSASRLGFAPSPPEAFDLAPGTQRTGLVLHLRHSSRIQGTVLSDVGSPVGGANVIANRVPFGEVLPTQTDAQGQFELTDLAPGIYQVESLEIRGEDSVASANACRVELGPGETATVVLGGIPREPIEVWGVVRAGGVELGLVKVQAQFEDDPLPGFRSVGHSGLDGSYELEVPRPGNTIFNVEPRFGIALVLHARVPDVARWRYDIDLPDASISGRVVDGQGRGVRGIAVQLEPDQTQARRFSHVAYGTTRSEEDGRFRFENLSAGVYSVWAGATTLVSEGEQRKSDGLGRSTRHGLEVGPGHCVDDLQLALEPFALVRGRVIAADRRPLEGGTAVLRDPAGRLMARSRLDPAEGGARFECRNLEAGTYFASAWSPPDKASLRSVQVSVAAGQELEVELELGLGAFAVVSLADESRRPIEPHVRALDARGGEAVELLGPPAQLLEKRIGPLVPGPWRIVADDGAGRAASAEVELRSGELRTIALRLE
jgi:hypothetical protein